MNKTKSELDHPAKSLEDIIHGLIYLYILTIPFQTLGFRLKGLTIALPELVFFILAPLSIISMVRTKQKLWIDKLDLFVLGWLVANILAGWFAGFDFIVVAQIIKTAYLIVLYMVLKWTIIPGMIERMIEVIIISSLVATVTGIIGFGLGYLGIDTTLSITRPFPYSIENVIQAKGFTPSPNMLASIIMIGILFQIQKLSMHQINSRGKDIFVVLILLLGFSLTFSKTMVSLLIGIILVLYFIFKSILSNTWRLIAITAAAILFIVNISGTHFILVKKHQDSEILKGDYIAGPTFIESDNYSIYPSQYWSLKEISLEAINQSFPWGLGSGKFNDFAHDWKKNDSYPTHVPYPDPHSTYLGTLAENGLLGLIVFLGIIYFIVKYSRIILSNQSANQYMFACLPSIFMVIGIKAVSTDVMNFRHYWILLILLVFTSRNCKSDSSNSLNL